MELRRPWKAGGGSALGLWGSCKIRVVPPLWHFIGGLSYTVGMKTTFTKTVRRIFLLGAVILWGALLFPGWAGAQVSSEAERALTGARIRVLKAS